MVACLGELFKLNLSGEVAVVEQLGVDLNLGKQLHVSSLQLLNLQGAIHDALVYLGKLVFI